MRCLKLLLVEQIRRILSARLYGIDFLCGWGDKISLTDDNPFKCKSTWTPDKYREPALDLFIHLITKYILNIKSSKIADNLTKQEREALKNLTERNDIVIKPADKGKATVGNNVHREI